MERFERTKLLLGNASVEKLIKSKVCIFGVGGVGGYVAEGLARCGVGTIDLVDKDIVSRSNINRQIIALEDAIGLYKVDVMKERILKINPQCNVTAYKLFYLPETENEIDFSKYDYIIDAIDTVSAKISIIENAKKNNVMVISAMGAGNKLDPMKFEISDINQTSVCPLARVMRYELKKRGIKGVKVCYSKEEPQKSNLIDENTNKQIPGSISFVPSVCGLLIAKEVVNDLLKIIEK